LTPQLTTGATPAELLLNRRPRTRLDLLQPNTADRIERKQSKQKELHDTHSKERQFVVGDTVSNYCLDEVHRSQILSVSSHYSFMTINPDAYEAILFQMTASIFMDD